MSGNRLVIVSEWMENGNINDYMKARADVNRLDLVRFPFGVLVSLVINDAMVGVARGCCQGVAVHA